MYRIYRDLVEYYAGKGVINEHALQRAIKLRNPVLLPEEEHVIDLCARLGSILQDKLHVDLTIDEVSEIVKAAGDVSSREYAVLTCYVNECLSDFLKLPFRSAGEYYTRLFNVAENEGMSKEKVVAAFEEILQRLPTRPADKIKDVELLDAIALGVKDHEASKSALPVRRWF